MDTKLEIAKNWLPRYTGMPLEKFGDHILITNFKDYITKFAERFSVEIYGEGRAMQASTNNDGLTIINYGIGSPNAATIMDLLVAVNPKGVLFLGKCGGLKDSSEIGNFILPIGAIRGDGTSNDYFPPEVPALPSFKLHKFVSDIIVQEKSDYRTGVIFTTNRRVWEHDKDFLERLKKTWMAHQNTDVIFISALKKKNIPEFKDLVYNKVREIHERIYPYNNFLYPDIPEES